MTPNIYLLEFAIGSLLRSKVKNISIVLIFTILVFLLTSIFSIANSIKYELHSTISELPDITIQKMQAGRVQNIDIDIVDDILRIDGIDSVIPRYWGYYYFANEGVNFSVVGIDPYEKQYREALEKIANRFDFDDIQNGMVIGQGVKEIMDNNFYKKYFNFIKPNGEFEKIYIKGVFDSSINLQSNDMILLPKDKAIEIFGIEEDKATDIVVTIPNKDEISTIADKIRVMLPSCRVITKEDMKISYINIFDYKNGVFLAIFIISLFTFFMIIYDKSSGLSSEEKKEIGILKSVGWKTDDILKEKFYEGFIISFVSFVSGVLLAMIFVYIFQAPLLKDIFMGYSVLRPQFELPFVFDFDTIMLIFLFSVPIYISATIIPSWRAAIVDADEMLR
jgi:ABC-type lipoprotein release transport system permease subunit